MKDVSSMSASNLEVLFIVYFCLFMEILEFWILDEDLNIGNKTSTMRVVNARGEMKTDHRHRWASTFCFTSWLHSQPIMLHIDNVFSPPLTRVSRKPAKCGFDKQRWPPHLHFLFHSSATWPKHLDSGCVRQFSDVNLWVYSSVRRLARRRSSWAAPQPASQPGLAYCFWSLPPASLQSMHVAFRHLLLSPLSPWRPPKFEESQLTDNPRPSGRPGLRGQTSHSYHARQRCSSPAESLPNCHLVTKRIMGRVRGLQTAWGRLYRTL